jgi:hypothetical protein
MRKRRHQGKRVCKQDLTEPGGNIIPLWLARGRNRRGRIRELRAKPAGIWAQASKRKRGDQEAGTRHARAEPAGIWAESN